MALNFWNIGAAFGATSVMAGAFASHGLRGRVTDQKLASFTTAAHYQMLHSAILLLTTQVAPQSRVAPSLFTLGMTAFSGSIYLLVLDPERFKFLGPVTPLGGLCLIGGWISLIFTKRLPITRPPSL